MKESLFEEIQHINFVLQKIWQTYKSELKQLLANS